MSHASKLNDWREDFRNTIRDVTELFEILELELPETLAENNFPLRVPREYVARMHKGDINDPLLKQILPVAAENQHVPGFQSDPVNDAEASPVPGLIHKYHGRVLLITTGACAIHCRYCFRRHFPYAEATASRFTEALDYIRTDNSITEVILSGGDPLSLSDDKLRELIQQLADIPHLKRLRVHSRLPIVLPSRVTDRLITALSNTRLQPIMIIHANHANEFDAAVENALKRLRDADILLFNQAVLLQGINDTASALSNLCETLGKHRVTPYYLNLLDRVQGAAHFEVSEPKALELMQALRARLPGYLMPTLVRDVTGQTSKMAVETSLSRLG